MSDFDWEQLARKVGAVRENTPLGPYSESGSTEIGLKALEEIIGRDFIRNAVDYQVEGGRGSQVIRSFLRLIHPASAMERCYEIFNSPGDHDTRIMALWLLADVADYRVLPWVNDFLDDPDESVGVLAAIIMDRLLWLGWQAPPDEFGTTIKKAESHHSQRVREQLAELRVRERFDEKVWLG